MQTDKPTPAEATHPRGLSLFQVSTIVYLLMAGIGSLVMQYVHGNLYMSFHVPLRSTDGLRLLAVGGLGAGILLVLSYLFEGWFPSYRDLKRMIAKVLGHTSFPMAIYLAVASSIGEEMLFRGAIQPFAGLALTSILFGLLHLGPNGSVSAWSLWAMVAGALLGWMFQETQSLWPPIMAHFVVNLIGILSLRKQVARMQAVTAKSTAAAERNQDA